MSRPSQARADARALLTAVPVGLAAGAVVGLALGGAYLAGGMAQDAVTFAKVSRLAQAAAGGFSDEDLRRMAQEDPGALSVALRYDPKLLAGYADHDRDLAQFVDKLDAKSEKASGEKITSKNLFLRASLGGDYNPAARPYVSSALDQSRQLDCLTQAVYYEARGETPSGQAAVAQVVLNRARHPAFPKTICGVVYQGAQRGKGCQFSFACDGSVRETRETGAWRRAQRVAARALGGYVMAEVGNATHFHVTRVNPAWGPNLMRVSQIGMHVFYRFNGRRGGPGAFTLEPQPETEAAPAPILASMTIAPADAKAAVQTLVGAVTKIEPAPSAVAAPAPPQVIPVPAEAKPKAETPAAS